jgi:lysophospholipid acyltransferase (LPLAT)-like uncharacterized protein
MNLLKQKWASFLLSRIVKMTIKAILLTCRFRVSGMENFVQAASKRKCILMMWHNRLTLVAEIMTRYAPQFKYAALISNSKDAEILASHTNSFSIGRAIRVPHDNRAQILQMMIKYLKYGNEVIIITPDGPRGPAKKVKPGAVHAAKETGASIVPLSWEASKVWKFNTWDKLMLPKPFSTITVKLGEAVKVESESNTQLLEEALNRLESN